ncbi:MAG: hypothetical protein LBI04_09385 [Treponema sp.]|jgi:hypothetical protein|nr:hypothetical protein [Treponema sp.]
MNNFENQLDEIRVNLYEETKKMNKEDIIRNVNSHAQKIAQEFGIKIENTVKENCFQTMTI